MGPVPFTPTSTPTRKIYSKPCPVHFPHALGLLPTQTGFDAPFPPHSPAVTTPFGYALEAHHVRCLPVSPGMAPCHAHFHLSLTAHYPPNPHAQTAACVATSSAATAPRRLGPCQSLSTCLRSACAGSARGSAGRPRPSSRPSRCCTVPLSSYRMTCGERVMDRGRRGGERVVKTKGVGEGETKGEGGEGEGE